MGTASNAINAVNNGTASWTQAVGVGAYAGTVGYGSNYIANQVFGNNQSFSWAALGSSIVGSMAGASLGKSGAFNALGKTASPYAYSLASASAATTIEDKWFGGSKPDYLNVSMAAIANTVGRQFGEQIDDWIIGSSAPTGIQPELLKSYIDRVKLYRSFGVSGKDSIEQVTNEYDISQADSLDMNGLKESAINALLLTKSAATREQAIQMVGDVYGSSAKNVASEPVSQNEGSGKNISYKEFPPMPTIYVKADGSNGSAIGDFLNKWQDPLSSAGRAMIRASEEIEKHPLIGYGLTAIQIMSGPIVFAGQTAVMASPLGDKINNFSGEVYNEAVSYTDKEGRIADLQKSGEMTAGSVGVFSLAAGGTGVALRNLSKIKAIIGEFKSDKTVTHKVFNRQEITVGFQDHHIISDKNKLTKNHELLDLAGYDLQSRSNKIFLPTDESLHPTRSIHSGRHLNSVSENLANQMDSIVEVGNANGWNKLQYKKALDALVGDERELLKSGEGALNKNARSWAK